jgi:hypothetical protein
VALLCESGATAALAGTPAADESDEGACAGVAGLAGGASDWAIETLEIIANKAAVNAAAIGLRTSFMVPPQRLSFIDGNDKPKDSLITALNAAN